MAAVSAGTRICVLRLSALGDVCHAVPLVRALQDQAPGCELTWIVGRAEARLASRIDGVRLVTYDKKSGLRGMWALRRALGPRPFDVLLATQRSARANLLTALVPARIRVGYDRARARELHGLVVNRRIAAAPADQHVMDCLLSFLEPIGLSRPAVPRWDFALSAEEEAFAREHIPDGTPTLIVSPASSHRVRNWSVEGYAAVADHARAHHGLRILLCGGPSALERELGEAIASRMREAPVNLIGRDTLGGFLALLGRARLLLGPDSGPAHLANAMGTPVLGLHAATDPWRSGPYASRAWCVNRFDDAAQRFLGKPGAALRWGKHIHHEGVTSLITVEEVIAALDRLLAATASDSQTLKVSP